MSTSEHTFEPTMPPISPEEKWANERRRGLGGSDIHELFPVLDLNDKDDPGSRYACPRRLSYTKLGIKPDYEHTPEELRLFERGHIMEEYAADRYVEKTGNRVFRSNKPYASSVYPFMRVNIDRRIKADERGVAPLECKSTNEFTFLRMQHEGLPISHMLQVQHAMAVMDAKWSALAVIEVPEYIDSVIEQLEDGRLRTRILNELAPKCDFFTFEVARDDKTIETIVEKESQFWNLIENGKLADPLPDPKDARCGKCQFRKACRGEQYKLDNAKVSRDKKSGIQYVQITDQQLAETVADRLTIMKRIEDEKETMAAIDLEIKQAWPKEVGAMQLGITKIRWNYQKGATRWDADALKADSHTIGRKIAFADWAREKNPELEAEFTQTVKDVPSLADKYQSQGAVTRPFVFTVGE